MILKGNQRGGGRDLAVHLLRADENEHVEVHELRGFSTDGLKEALLEAQAVSRGTRAKQYLFSLSLNPPRDAQVGADAFETAIETIEQRLGLTGQPRAIVFHEKDGRRHAHAVWSRIDAGAMKAINLPFYKSRLRDVSRELYLEHGWQLPRGLMNSQERDPANFSLAEWQQAKRAGQDPKALKQLFQECWAASDSGKAFAAALQARGYALAQGDRRSYVAVDYRGEVYGIARTVGARAAEVKARLGDAAKLSTIEQATAAIATRLTGVLQRHAEAIEAKLKTQSAALTFKRTQTVQAQRTERAQLDKAQQTRFDQETRDRAARLRGGLRGIWDWLTGRRSEVTRQNELEAQRGRERDRQEKDALIRRQLEQRRTLHAQIKQERSAQAEQRAAFHRDLAELMKRSEPASPNRQDRATSEPARKPSRKQRDRTLDQPTRKRSRKPRPQDREPEA